MQPLQIHPQMASILVYMKPSQKVDHHQKEVSQKLESIS